MHAGESSCIVVMKHALLGLSCEVISITVQKVTRWLSIPCVSGVGELK